MSNHFMEHIGHDIAMLCNDLLDWVAPPILPAIWVRSAQGSGEEQYIFF